MTLGSPLEAFEAFFGGWIVGFEVENLAVQLAGCITIEQPFFGKS